MKEFIGTKGEWSLPHFASEETTCDCRYVLSEQYCGSIATVDWSVDNSIQNGDNPPLEEAKANARLIASAPKLLQALQAMIDLYESTCAVFPTLSQEKAYIEAKQVIEKAL